MNRVRDFINLPFSYHLAAGALIRVCLVIYSNYHDNEYDVPYTDVDYKVFTDAARHIVEGHSPYKRDTYRYSPLIAYLMVPNVIIGKDFGKYLFCFFDILLAMALKTVVKKQLATPTNSAVASEIANKCACCWIYNPMSIGISTRGNADSVSCLMIILAILFLQTDITRGFRKYVFSGTFLGIAIHLRMYPVVFSFPMYLSLCEQQITRNTSFKDALKSLLPNKNQLILTVCCLATLICVTKYMYILHGYEFLFETYIYHLFRKDIRHNFSVMFYYSYLTMDQLVLDIVKIIAEIFELVILFVLSLAFGSDPETLAFSMFSQAMVLVAYNTVMTSQYFIWFISLAPLVIHNMKMSRTRAFALTVLWAGAQGLWLHSAYLLEFLSVDRFLYLWLYGILFFFANVYVLAQFVVHFTPGYGFGRLVKND